MRSTYSLFSKKSLYVFLFAGFFAAVPALADDSIPAGTSSHKGLNVTVTSSGIGPTELNDKTDPEFKSNLSNSDKNTAVDINENGEPNLNMRF